jgi:hypothetical protein
MWAVLNWKFALRERALEGLEYPPASRNMKRRRIGAFQSANISMPMIGFAGVHSDFGRNKEEL